MVTLNRQAWALISVVAGALALCGCVSEGRKGGAVAAAPSGPAPAFAKKPAATAEGDKVRIDFSVSRETDLAVSVVDAEGRVVRHLAGGLLGKNAPEPLASDSLSQSLVWDRRDDAGRPVPPGRYRTVVALGLTPGAVRSLGWDPGALGRVHGLAVGPGGTLYAMGEGDYGFARIATFDAKGAYRSTIVPRSATLPLERVTPLGEIVLNDGQRIPRELLPEYGSNSTQAPAVTPEGDLIFVNGPGRGHPEGHRFSSAERGASPPRRLLCLAADGGVPAAGYLGPLLGKGFEKANLYLALAADGKTVYVSGARHAVFRVTWGQESGPVPVAGTPDTPGDGEKLKDPCGIALDATGNLYIADRGNHRVATFGPDGKLLGQIAVQWPRQVLVHAKTGAVYVTSGYRQYRLLKFATRDDREPSVELDLRSSDPVLALDPRAARPCIYAANLQRAAPGAKDKGPAIVRLADIGREFHDGGQLLGGTQPARHFLLGADRGRELVYAMTAAGYGYARFDGRTGREAPVDILLHPKANGVSEITTAADGTIAMHVQGEFGRMDGGLRPQPFTVSGTPITRLEGDDCPRSNFDRGCCVAPNGDIYWIHERGGYAKPMLCGVLAPDGSLKKDVHIVFESGSPAAIRVDRKGCVYVLDHLKPVGRLLPDAFEGKVPVARFDRFTYNYGSLLKFAPAGGAVRKVSDKDPGSPGPAVFTTAEGRGRFAAEGLAWSHFGISMIQPALARSEKSPYCCQCWAARFDLDGFDRAFVPDQLRCTVQVLDSNGNPITRLGGYGNVDDAGVALADPRSVMVTDEAAYIGDAANGRILRVELAYRARAECAVEVPGPAVTGPKPGPSAAAYRTTDPVKTRLAAIWAKWGAPGGEKDRGELRAALADESQLLRVAAGYCLLHVGDPAGQAEVFRGAQSKDPDIYKLAETAIIKEAVRWDPEDPRAKLLDPALPIVPRFPVGKAEVEALAPLLEAEAWHLNRAVIGMVGLSGRPEAVPPLLAKLRAPNIRDRNLNRVLGALGLLRSRAAVPDMLKYLARGRDEKFGTEDYNGDRAEIFAATALGRVADPESVAPIIALLDSPKVNTPAEALRALSMMFDPQIPDDQRVLPKGEKVERVRVDRLPPAAEIKAAWEAFWKAAAGRYEWSDAGPGLKEKPAGDGK